MTISGVRLDVFDRYAVMSNGHTVHLRAACSADAARVRRFYEQLGDTSTYYRFFGLRRAIPDGEVAALVGSELPRHATLLACIHDEVVGVGEFHITKEPTEAEVAFAVSDDQQGHGIATLLLEDLAVLASEVGVRRFVAATLPGNAAMQLVFRTAGLIERHRFEDGLMNVVLDLADRDGLRHEAFAREIQAVAASLDAVFRARHVVVFGDAGPGTATTRRIAGALGAMFTGRVSVVDPGPEPSAPTSPAVASGEALIGMAQTRVRSLADLATVPDLAILAVAPADTMAALLECGTAGVRAALVVSTDPAGVTRLFGSFADVAHRLDMRIIGPCAGLAVPPTGLFALRDVRPIAIGSVAVLARGDRAAAALQRAVSQRGLGVTAFVTTGHSTDVVTEDYLCWWALDTATRVILLDLDHEPLRHRYRRVVRAVAAQMPVIVLTEDRDHHDALMHPGAAALVDADGVIHVRDRAELLDLGAFFAAVPDLAGPRFMIVTDWAASGDTTEVATVLAMGRAMGLVPGVPTASTIERLRAVAAVSVTDGCVALPPTGRATDSPGDVHHDDQSDALVDVLVRSGQVDACLTRVRGRLLIRVAGGDGGSVAVPLGLASWEHGLAALARAWARHAHVVSRASASTLDELYCAADGTAEPLR